MQPIELLVTTTYDSTSSHLDQSDNSTDRRVIMKGHLSMDFVFYKGLQSTHLAAFRWFFYFAGEWRHHRMWSPKDTTMSFIVLNREKLVDETRGMRDSYRDRDMLF